MNNKAYGHIRINSIEIKDGAPGISSNPFPWVGTYFTQIPVEFEAHAGKGYRFVG